MPQRRASGVSRRTVLTGVPAVLIGRAFSVSRATTPSTGFTLQPLVEPKRSGFVHLVLAAEGFRDQERAAFLKQAELISTTIRTQEPFASFADRLLLTLAWQPSRDSGIPCEIEHDEVSGRWVCRPSDRQTVFQTKLQRGRYVIELSNYHAVRAIREVSPHPIDNLIVVVNDPDYGGGARAAVDMPAAAYHAHKTSEPISYAEALKTFTFGLTVVTCDPKLGRRVLIHELGHSLANLGEEYFNPSVAFTPNADHPAVRKPNVSMIADPTRVKWKDLLGVDRVGVFEGAEGFGRGLYRPWDDGCVMRRPEHREFCPVCRRAIEAELQSIIARRNS